MPPLSTRSWSGDFIADAVVGRLYFQDREVALTRKAIKTLLILIANPDTMVDRDRLPRRNRRGLAQHLEQLRELDRQRAVGP
jgi:DNA-binding winged helix-turn-helix (wHTH) protein